MKMLMVSRYCVDFLSLKVAEGCETDPLRCPLFNRTMVYDVVSFHFRVKVLAEILKHAQNEKSDYDTMAEYTCLVSLPTMNELSRCSFPIM